MNIFVLDKNIEACARYHADQHVVKMILEGAQMLCTVLHRSGISAPYKPTHLKHPCTIWCAASLSNWVWLHKLVMQLNREYKYRFRKTTDHKSAGMARGLPVPPIADQGLTAFAQAMPDAYRQPGDAVQAYRNYYVGEKHRFAKWTRRRPPKWYTTGMLGRKNLKGGSR